MSLIQDLRIVRMSRKPIGLMLKHLPVCTMANGFHWQCREPEQMETLALIQDAFENAEGNDPNRFESLKISGGRRVLRVHQADDSFIVKAFSYTDSLGKQLFRHRVYALDEALGLMLAWDRGISVPRVMAYGEQRSGIRRLASMVVMEDVKDSFHPVDVFRGDQSFEITVEGVLKRVTPLMRQLYESGCNHIDVHGTSFLLHKFEENLDKVIDFQFAVFHPRPSERILACQLAHFARASFKDVSADILDDWAYSAVRDITGKNCNELINLYLELSRKPVGSTYLRMALKP